jgi:hypothetical protein
MDASKLRNSCICGNTIPYLDCCGRFANPLALALDNVPEIKTKPGAGSKKSKSGISKLPDPSIIKVPVPRSKGGPIQVPEAEDGLHYSFRHTLHELSIALFPLRAIYQAYWDKLNKEDYPHEILMEDPEYGRSVIENFFWDYFVQYSDARPILRTAREIEAKDLRLSHDLMQWAFVPLWFYRVQDRNAKTAKLLNLGNNKIHTVHHSGHIPEAGSGLLTRVLPFRGREFCGHAALALPPGIAPTHLDALFRAGCRELGVKTSVTLRPDVHCEEWRRHGSLFLSLWRSEVYDSQVGRPRRGAAAPMPFNLVIQNHESMVATLSTSVECISTHAGIWDLKYRSLRLARLEPRGKDLLVTLADGEFRNHVLEWLKGRMGQAVSIKVGADQALPGSEAESQDVWIHTALDALNAQTPIQASTHDWGRRRLQILLKDLMKQGVDITSLKRQLGI